MARKPRKNAAVEGDDAPEAVAEAVETAEAPKRRGRPPNAPLVRCRAPNVKLSTGEILRRGEAGREPDADSFALMLHRGQVELAE